MRKLLAIAALTALAACDNDADVASENISQAADNFEVMRRVVFYNGITDTYMLEVTGWCSIDDDGKQLELTCKLGEGSFVKHFLHLSDNTTYFAEQLEGVDVSTSFYRVTFKPSVILPANIELR